MFQGTINLTSGNITLRAHNITYQFQVSASTSYGQNLNEGELSSVTSNATIFVAEQGSYFIIMLLNNYALQVNLQHSLTGHPTPVQLQVRSVTNTTVILGWAYPPPPTETIQSFLVSAWSLGYSLFKPSCVSSV